MSRNKGTFKFSSNFEVKISEPLDPRSKVKTLAELTNPDTYPRDGDVVYIYKDLITTVEENDGVYILTDPLNFTNLSSWKRLGEGNGSGESIPGKDGKSAYEIAVSKGYIGTEEEWLKSLKGADGKSAYQLAVEQGYLGTSEEWIASLKGEVGPVGPRGLQGIPGPKGADGTGVNIKASKEECKVDGDAYINEQGHIMIKLGNTFKDGGEIKGPQGDSIKEVRFLKLGNTPKEHIYGVFNDKSNNIGEFKVTDGNDGGKGADGINGKDGTNGLSAYEIAVQQGYKGDQQKWLESLKGKDGLAGPSGDQGIQGIPGDSAYLIAIKDGYIGTLKLWLESLKGEIGPAGIQGPPGIPGNSGASITNIKSAGAVEGGNKYNVYTDKNSNTPIGSFIAPEGPRGLQGDPGIQGPRGLQGADGTSVKILGSLNSKDELSGKNKNQGDGYMIKGDLWVYNGNSITDSSHVHGFENVGKIQGPKGDTGPIGLRGYHPYKVVYSGTEKENTDGNKYLFILNDGLETPIQLEIIAPRGPQGPSGGQGSPGKTGPRGYSITSVSANGVEAKLGNNYDIFIDKPSGSSSTTKIGSIIAPKGDPGSGGPRGPLGYSIVEVIKTKSDSQGNLYSILTNLNGTLGAQSNHTVIGTFTAPTGPLGFRGYSIVSVEDHKGSQNTTIGNSYDIYSNQPSSVGPRTLLGTIIAPLGPEGPQGPAALQIQSVRSYEVLSDIGNKYLLLLSNGNKIDGIFIAPLGPIGPIGPRGPKGDNGTSVTIKGSISRKEELDSKSLGVKIGDSYLLNGDLWVYNGNSISNDKHYKGFENVGKILGPLGEPGPEGPRGEPGLMGTFNTENLKTINGEIIIKEIGNNTIYTVGSENDNKGKHIKQVNQKGEVFNDYENNSATGNCSHAEGKNTMSNGVASHSEGINTKATGNYSHSEGYLTQATAPTAHAEGSENIASGPYSHAEGGNNKATNERSHAEGGSTEAKGENSHAEGIGNVTNNNGEHACGAYNFSTPGKTLFTIGNGLDKGNRKNAVEVTNDGKVYINGLGKYNGNNYSLSNSLQTVINTLTADIKNLNETSVIRRYKIKNENLPSDYKYDIIIGDDYTAEKINYQANGTLNNAIDITNRGKSTALKITSDPECISINTNGLCKLASIETTYIQYNSFSQFDNNILTHGGFLFLNGNNFNKFITINLNAANGTLIDVFIKNFNIGLNKTVSFKTTNSDKFFNYGGVLNISFNSPTNNICTVNSNYHHFKLYYNKYNNEWCIFY